jgi:hypothetical protein
VEAPSFRIASDYEHWLLARYPVPQQDDILVSGPWVDADYDGVPLMMEYAFASNPDDPADGAMPEHVIVLVGGVPRQALEFNRRIGTDLRFALQVSTDLIQWQDASSTVEVIGAIDGTTERCRLVDPESLTGKRFIRLGVSLP